MLETSVASIDRWWKVFGKERLLWRYYRGNINHVIIIMHCLHSASKANTLEIKNILKERTDYIQKIHNWNDSENKYWIFSFTEVKHKWNWINLSWMKLFIFCPSTIMQMMVTFIDSRKNIDEIFGIVIIFFSTIGPPSMKT